MHSQRKFIQKNPFSHWPKAPSSEESKSSIRYKNGQLKFGTNFLICYSFNTRRVPVKQAA